MYRLWPRGLPADVELCAVQLPGRAERIGERPIDAMGPLVDGLLEAIAPLLDRPCFFFGHSMGAALAYELARALADEHLPGPAHLMLSARRAPGVPPREADLATLADEAFVDAVQARYRGIPPEVRAHADLLALVLPALRADLTALERWRPRPGPALACPITAFAAREDATAACADMAPWANATCGAFSLVELPGGHLHVAQDPGAILARVAAIAAMPLPLSRRVLAG